MAFNPIQIDPIDFLQDIAIGVNLPFSNTSVFKSNYQTKDAIKNNLINFFLTNPGERPLNPLFGGGLRAYLFEQINTNNLDNLKENVSDKIYLFFPNILINSLLITKQDDNYLIKVTLKYSILNTNASDTLEFQL